MFVFNTHLIFLYHLQCRLYFCYGNFSFFTSFKNLLHSLFFLNYSHFILVFSLHICLFHGFCQTQCLELNSVSCSNFFLNLFIIYFWLCWVFVAACGLSLVVASGATLCCSARASHCSGFLCCGACALGGRVSVVMAHGLSSCGSRTLEHRLSGCGARA